jgi:hypothetical protein
MIRLAKGGIVGIESSDEAIVLLDSLQVIIYVHCSHPKPEEIIVV